MAKQCYYDTLKVPKDASHDDIKSAFRKLSMQTHPDVAGGSQCTMEKFKQISEAHQVLSNPKEKRRYDLQLQEKLWYQRPASAHGGFYSNPNMRKPPEGPKATGAFAVVETMFKPRNFIMGLTLACATTMAYNAMFGGDDKRKILHHNKALVEAWKNPKTNRWESPAPWDPTYRRLQPVLEMVPREQVQTRTR